MDKNHMSALRTKHEALDRKINEEETRPLPDTNRIHSQKREASAERRIAGFSLIP